MMFSGDCWFLLSKCSSTSMWRYFLCWWKKRKSSYVILVIIFKARIPTWLAPVVCLKLFGVQLWGRLPTNDRRFRWLMCLYLSSSVRAYMYVFGCHTLVHTPTVKMEYLDCLTAYNVPPRCLLVGSTKFSKSIVKSMCIRPRKCGFWLRRLVETCDNACVIVCCLCVGSFQHTTSTYFSGLFQEVTEFTHPKWSVSRNKGFYFSDFEVGLSVGEKGPRPPQSLPQKGKSAYFSP